MSRMFAGTHHRYALSSPVELHCKGHDDAAGLLIELTQETARVSQLEPGRYTPGDPVTVRTSCGRTLDALVQSTFGCRANLRFAAALHLPELADLVQANRPSSAYA